MKHLTLNVDRTRSKYPGVNIIECVCIKIRLLGFLERGHHPMTACSLAPCDQVTVTERFSDRSASEAFQWKEPSLTVQLGWVQNEDRRPKITPK